MVKLEDRINVDKADEDISTVRENLMLCTWTIRKVH